MYAVDTPFCLDLAMEFFEIAGSFSQLYPGIGPRPMHNGKLQPLTLKIVGQSVPTRHKQTQ